MSHTPTPEQAAIIDAFAGGGHLVVEAGAGTGKTSTLKMLAGVDTSRRGVYIAYNRSIAGDAAREFPRNVLCKTAHGLAYAAVGRQFAARLRAPRLPARETARILGIREPLHLAKDRAPLAPQQLARLVTETIQRYCYSSDERITRRHVPLVNGIDTDPERAALARVLVPAAQRAWDEDLTQADGQLRFTHDCYLKIWTLSRPQLGADFVLLDEAQDSNPCVAALVDDQHAQRIWVGDRCQAIYGWRGAVDAMAHAAGQRLYLSQSFRFGPAIADEANKWLSVLASPLRLRGFDRIPSRVGYLDAPEAVLCRSNAEAVRQVAAATTAGRPAALVGGGREIRSLAEAAIDLRSGRGTSHPDLFAFSTWGEVQDYVEHDAAGSDLKVAVGLIDTYGAEGVIAIIDRLVPEEHAAVVVSTAHKAKGREWKTVQIAPDFREPKSDEETGEPATIPDEDAMLAYVAVTRAREVLDRDGLAWVDRWITPPLPSVTELIAGEAVPGCRDCGCTEDDACPGGCAWATTEQQLAAGLDPMLGDLCTACLHPTASSDGLDCEPGPHGTLISPICLRCTHPRRECTCRLMPQVWSANAGVPVEDFPALVRARAAMNVPATRARLDIPADAR